MSLPQSPVTLSAAQVAELNTRLSEMRHNINNQLSLIVAAVELIQRKPESGARMVETIGEQPGRIAEEMKRFSTAFERACGIARD
jgi:methyl-accepting chemotaxis protein